MDINKMPLPKIIIVGRPNVGKSTLFNRMVKRRKAIVEKAESTTRDRISEVIDHEGCLFELSDTGGVDLSNKQDIPEQVEGQVFSAVKQADKIILVCDAKTGVVPLDRKISEFLRRFNKKIILVVNKVDNRELLQNNLEFYSLGLGEPVQVSALHGSGVGDLLDIIARDIKPGGEALNCHLSTIRLTVAGRPNSGKSSFVNSVLGEERVIVSPEPGTTRDSVDTYFERQGEKFVIIDTAGMRSKGKIKDEVTYLSIVRTEESIKKSDVVLLLMDGIEGVTKEDFRIISVLQDSLRPFALAVNKWDLCRKEGVKAKDYESAIRKSLRFIYNAPVIFMSALTGEKVSNALDTVSELAKKSRMNFSTSRLNEILKQISIKTTRLYSISQVKNTIPEFEIIAKKPSVINEPEKRHVMNILRKELELDGIPVKLNFRKKRFLKERKNG